MYKTTCVTQALFGLVIRITPHQYRVNFCLKIAVINRNKPHRSIHFDDIEMQYDDRNCRLESLPMYVFDLTRLRRLVLGHLKNHFIVFFEELIAD